MAANLAEKVSLNSRNRELTETIYPLFGTRIEVITAPVGTTMDVSHLIKHPEEYHGDPTQVHHLINFGQLFTRLIGRHRYEPGSLAGRRIIVAEDVSPERKDIAEVGTAVTTIAAALMQNPNLYDNKDYGEAYYQLVKRGYALLKELEEEFSVGGQNGLPISLLRGGAVATRAARGVHKEAVIWKEVGIISKRTHLIDKPDTDLAVTITWKDRNQAAEMSDKSLDIADIVNPASGASIIAAVLAAKEHGFTPKQVNLRAIMIAYEGAVFTQNVLRVLGVDTTIYALAGSDELNSQYYLVGNNYDGKPRYVGDAGNATRFALPKRMQERIA